MKKPKVIGIGGIFLKSKRPEVLKQWYRDELGFNLNPYGSSFEFRNAHRPDETNYFLWSLFPNDTDYFNPSKKNFMINYRVQSIEALVDQLRNRGIKIIDDIVSYPYGKFIHILDPEGNAIELWEANDAFFHKMMGTTNK